MNPYDDLPSENRESLIAALRQRISRTKDPEWRAVWKARLRYIESGEESASGALNQLLTASNQDVRFAAATTLAEFAELQSDLERAIKMYELALGVDPNAGIVQYHAASCLERLGRREEARRRLLDALAVSNQARPRWLALAGQAYERLVREDLPGRVADATMAEARENFPDAFAVTHDS